MAGSSGVGGLGQRQSSCVEELASDHDDLPPFAAQAGPSVAQGGGGYPSSFPIDPSQKGDLFAGCDIVVARRGKDGKMYRVEVTQDQFLALKPSMNKIRTVVLQAAEENWGLGKGTLSWNDISYDWATRTVALAPNVQRADLQGKARVSLKDRTDDAFEEFSQAAGRIWSSESVVNSSEGSGRKGLGGSAWQGAALLKHAVDVGGFISSNGMKSMMEHAKSLKVDSKDALKRIAHTEAMITGLTVGVRAKIEELEKKVDTLNKEIENLAAQHDQKYRKASEANDDTVMKEALEEMKKTAIPQKLQERKEHLAALENLHKLESQVKEINRDACYWAAGIGQGGATQKEKIARAQGVTKALQERLELTQKDVPEATRQQYANQVGDLLLGDRSDYIERTLAENRKPKEGSLELFIVQMVLREGKATADEATQWIPDDLRKEIDLCHEIVAEEHVQTTIELGKAKTELENKTWEEQCKVLQDKKILASTVWYERAKRWGGRNVGERLPSPSIVGASLVGTAVKGALPQWFGRKATAAEIAETYGASIQAAPSAKSEKATWGPDASRTVKAKQAKLAELIKVQQEQQKTVQDAFAGLQRAMGDVRSGKLDDLTTANDLDKKRRMAISNLCAIDQSAQKAELAAKKVEGEFAALQRAEQESRKARDALVELGLEVDKVPEISDLKACDVQAARSEIAQKREAIAVERITVEQDVLQARDAEALAALKQGDLTRIETLQKDLTKQHEDIKRDLGNSDSLKSFPGRSGLENQFTIVQTRMDVMYELGAIRRDLTSIDESVDSVDKALEDVPSEATAEKIQAWVIAKQLQIDAIMKIALEGVKKLRSRQSALSIPDTEKRLQSVHLLNEQALWNQEQVMTGIWTGVVQIRMAVERRFFEEKRQTLRANIRFVDAFRPGEEAFPAQALLNAQTAAQAIKDQRMTLSRHMKESVSFDPTNEEMTNQLTAFEVAAQTEEKKFTELKEKSVELLVENDRVLAFKKAIVVRDQALKEFQGLLPLGTFHQGLQYFVDNASIPQRKQQAENFNRVHQGLQRLIAGQKEVECERFLNLVDHKRDFVQKIIKKESDKGFGHKAEFIRNTIQ